MTEVGAWKIMSLGDICEKITQGPNPKYDGDASAGYRVLKTKDVYDDGILYETADSIGEPVFTSHLRFELRPGDLLLAIVGRGSINKCNVFEGSLGLRFIFTRALGLIRTNPDLVEPHFLKYFLQSDLGKIMVDAGIGGTSGQEVVTTTHLKSLRIPLPSLTEQRRIVAVLDDAFAALATATTNAEKNLANARELFERALADVFEDQGSDWVVEPLRKHVRFIDYRGKTPPKRQAGVRLITAKNVKMGRIQRQPEEFIDPAAYDGWMTRGIPRKGDVLFTTEAPLGNVAQLDTEERVVIGQRLITMQPDESRLDRTFLKYMLCSSPLQRAILEQATGATVSGIKAKLLKEIPIAYPRRMREQREIINRLDTLNDLANSLSDIAKLKIEALAFLKQALLHRAFSGQLTGREPIAA